MTIQIDELIVRTTVVEGAAAGGGDAGGGKPSAVQREQLLEACVERVLEILRRREER